MKLTKAQSQTLLRERGIWITEACDKCGKLLGSVRWTRRGEPGEWCAAECRDGIKDLSKVQSRVQKTCLECGVTLEGKRVDSEFCPRMFTGKRLLRSPQNSAAKRQFIAETPIGKQGLTNAQNGGSMNTLSRSTQVLETAVSAMSVSAGGDRING